MFFSLERVFLNFSIQWWTQGGHHNPNVTQEFSAKIAFMKDFEVQKRMKFLSTELSPNPGSNFLVLEILDPLGAHNKLTFHFSFVYVVLLMSFL